MSKCEVTIWKKGNKYGITKYFNSCQKGRKYVKQQKRDKRFKRESIIQIRVKRFHEIKRKHPKWIKN